MMKLAGFLFLIPICLAILPSLCSSENLKPGLYARFSTDKGGITAVLYFQKTPLTVISFAGLAQGTVASDRGEGIKYFDGLTFHRVVENFMIQGGDPTGTGRGGPGYRFPDEFVKDLKHDSAGILSMANAGPGTNGSQFFITHGPTSHLDGKHTVFGKVIEGQDVVDKIEKGDKIQTLEIIRVGKDAEAFKTDQAAFDAHMKKIEELKQNAVAEERKQFEKDMLKLYPDAQTTKSGLMYVQHKKGSGDHPAAGSMVSVHYKGTFRDGKVFDSSYDRGEPIEFKAGVGQVIKGWDEALLSMKKGEKRTLLIPYWLGYGERGYPGAIPPKSDLIFEVELMGIK